MRVRAILHSPDKKTFSLDIVDDQGNTVKKGASYPMHQIRKKGVSFYTELEDKCIFRLTVLSYEGEYEIVCVNPYINI
jgi:hypothetical protein